MDNNLQKLRELTKKLLDMDMLEVRGDDFYKTVARLAKIQPEAGYDLLDNAAIGVHLVDGNGMILWANAFELEALDYKPHEYFGKSITDFHLDPDVIEHILKTLVGGGMLDAYPARLKASNGDVAYVLINSNVYTKDEKFVHTRCFTMQISKSTYDSLRKDGGNA